MEDELPATAFELNGYNEELSKREVVLSYNEDDAEIDHSFSIHGSEPLYATEWLAVLAHRLWTHWSQHIAEEEDISQDRLDRWQNLWVPFDELSKEMQEKDEELVERFLDEMPDYGDADG